MPLNIAITNFPNGVSSFGVPILGPGGLLPFTGNYWFVEETQTIGASAGEGSFDQPFNSLSQALSAATPNNNDVIFLTGTVHQTTALLWNKGQTHLIGLCNGVKRGKRARISSSGTTPFSNLVNVSQPGCLFANFGTFYGFPTTGATSPIAWLDTGGRNAYDNVEFLGFGDATVTTGTANQTAARAFKLSGTTGETTLRGCVFGVDTVQRGAVNYTVEISGGAPRVTLEDCDFEADLAAGGAGGSHLLIASGGIDRYLDIVRANFWAATKSGGTAMTQALNVSASAGGIVQIRDSTGFGFTHWETSASGSVVINMPAPTAHDGGIAVAASPS